MSLTVKKETHISNIPYNNNLNYNYCFSALNNDASSILFADKMNKLLFKREVLLIKTEKKTDNVGEEEQTVKETHSHHSNQRVTEDGPCSNDAHQTSISCLKQAVNQSENSSFSTNCMRASEEIFFALANNCSDTIKDYVECAKSFQADKRLDFLNVVLKSKNADGIPGLYLAFKKGHYDAIRAYTNLLDLLPNCQRATTLVNAILIIDNNGCSRLITALKEATARETALGKTAEAMAIYEDMLSLVPNIHQDGIRALIMSYKQT